MKTETQEYSCKKCAAPVVEYVIQKSGRKGYKLLRIESGQVVQSYVYPDEDGVEASENFQSMLRDLIEEFGPASLPTDRWKVVVDLEGMKDA
jgi:hypothetical protein